MTVDHAATGDKLTGVSCPTTSFCMAVDESGNYVVYDRSSWSAVRPATPGSPAFHVSCASSSFCILTGYSGYSVFNGSSWTVPDYLGSNGNDISLGAVSCVSQRFCTAITNALGANEQTVAGVSIYDGTGWSAPQSIGLKATLTDDVSCTSASFCVAVGNTGKFPGAASIYNGSSWSHPVVIDRKGGPLVSVSCGRRFCLAEDSNPLAEHTFRYNGRSWSRPSVIGTPSDFNSQIACLTSRFCMATTQQSRARSFNGRTWSPQTGQVMRAGINSLSCATPRFCVAVGDFGKAAIYHR